MDYEWDVFVSYRRVAPVGPWTQRVFVPTLRKWLPQYLGPSTRVFIDVDEDPALGGLPPGSAWHPTLQDALLKSRCLVAVLSAEYFESEWCRAEFQTMLERQSQAGTGLIIPVRFADGNFYAPEAKALQHIDFEQYNTYRRESQASRSFIDQVKKVSQVLTTTAGNAPRWDPSWQVRVPPPAQSSHVPRPTF